MPWITATLNNYWPDRQCRRSCVHLQTKGPHGRVGRFQISPPWSGSASKELTYTRNINAWMHGDCIWGETRLQIRLHRLDWMTTFGNTPFDRVFWGYTKTELKSELTYLLHGDGSSSNMVKCSSETSTNARCHSVKTIHILELER